MLLGGVGKLGLLYDTKHSGPSACREGGREGGREPEKVLFLSLYIFFSFLYFLYF